MLRAANRGAGTDRQAGEISELPVTRDTVLLPAGMAVLYGTVEFLSANTQDDNYKHELTEKKGGFSFARGETLSWIKSLLPQYLTLVTRSDPRWTFGRERRSAEGLTRRSFYWPMPTSFPPALLVADRGTHERNRKPMLLERRTDGIETLFDPPLSLQEAVPLLERLVRESGFLTSWILPSLEQGYLAGNWHVARRYDAPDGSYSLQVFVWPPGTGTRIHDHSSWGAFCCAVGAVLEERYERLDDGSQQGRAHLRKAWRRVWRKQDGVSTLLPLEGGIHRIANPGNSTAVSVHLYGPRIVELDGRDYDPSRDYVCDRP